MNRGAAGELSVLVVDDDELVRKTFCKIVERAGLGVIEADDGLSGIARFRERRPSAVLLDLRMPGKDGLDVLSTFVTEAPETPVLVVSGEGTMNDVVEALRRGAWDYVMKPISNSELLIGGIWRSLEKAALLRQNREYGESLREMNFKLSRALEDLRADEQAARQLQFQLLPPDGQRLGFCTFFSRLLPSRLLSGDFVNYFPLGVDVVGPEYAVFYMVDVAGRGVASAFVTAIVATLVDKYREAFGGRGEETILHPTYFLTRLDEDLRARQLDKHLTMFFGVIDLATGCLRYSNAGAFPFPIVWDGTKPIELECCGRPLNLPGGGEFVAGEVTLKPGARVLLASDGVLEVKPKRGYRQRREELGQSLRSATNLDAVLETLGIDGTSDPTDDIALMLIRREEDRG